MKIRWPFRVLAIAFILFVLAGLFQFDVEYLWERLHPCKITDWTETGLNPNTPEFTPEVLFIAGEVKANETHFAPYEGNRYFEITMRGRNQYFRKEWVGREGKRGSWWNVQLVLGGFEGTMGRRFGRFGTKGGGGSGDWTDAPPEKTPLIVARNLWNDLGLVGATEESQTKKDQWSKTEIYKNLERRGNFRIPRTILFTINHGIYYGGEQTATYIVKRIEFRDKPQSDWFGEMKQKYFPHADDPEKATEQNSKTNAQTAK